MKEKSRKFIYLPMNYICVDYRVVLVGRDYLCKNNFPPYYEINWAET